MIRFGDIIIEGFGSIKSLKFNFDQIGLNIIKGENGAGKTTILSALSWAWYKRPLKDVSNIQTWPHLQGEDFQGTMVSSICHIGDIEYKIIRCIKYKGLIGEIKGGDGLFFYINGQPFTEYENKIHLNKIIISKLGFSFELFRNTIVFGQKMKRLIDETGTKQKEIFDELFESVFITRSREMAKSDLQDKILEVEETERDLEYIKDKIQDNKELIYEHNRAIDNYNDSIITQRTQLKNDIKSLQQSVDNYHNRQNLLNKLLNSPAPQFVDPPKEPEKWDASALLGSMDDVSQKISKIGFSMEELKKAMNITNKVCDRCNQPIDQDLYDKQQKQNQKRLKNQEKAYALLERERDKLNKKKAKHEKADNKYKISKERYDSLMKQYRQYNDEVDNLKTQQDITSEQKVQLNTAKKRLKKLKLKKPGKLIKKYEQKIGKLKTKKKTLKNTLKVANKEIETLKWLVDDALSNKGLKAFLFQSLIKSLNKHLLNYSPICEGVIEFSINTSSAAQNFQITFTKEDNTVPYNDLSGGQAQLVNVVIAFAMHDSTMVNKPVNILLMDEVFESLSKNNIEKVSSLIETKSKDTAVFLVTHLDSFISTNANLYQFTLDQGYTGIV